MSIKAIILFVASVSVVLIYYFGFIPWKGITVTPASQMQADNLYTVYDGNLIP